MDLRIVFLFFILRMLSLNKKFQLFSIVKYIVNMFLLFFSYYGLRNWS